MSDYTALFKGSVVNNIDPEGRKRITASIPAVLADAVSGWCEPVYSEATSVPLVGEVVWISFANGDLTMPVYISASPQDSAITPLLEFMGFTRTITANKHFLY